jgi:hypothetical protein
VAIASQDSIFGSANSPIPPAPLNTPASVGDLIVINLMVSGSDVGSSPTLSDQLGNVYTYIARQYDSADTAYTGLYYSVVTVAGTPTIAAANYGGQYGAILADRFNGFSPGVITVDAALVTTNSTTTTPWTAGAPVSNYNNELIVAAFNDFANGYIASTNYSSSSWQLEYVVSATAGTTETCSVTIGNTPPNQGVVFAGFYSAPFPAPVSQRYKRRGRRRPPGGMVMGMNLKEWF